MDKNMTKISIIGIGKLGLPFALILAEKGFEVMGVDIHEKYVHSLNNKVFKTVEPKVEKLLIKTQSFQATTSLKQCIDFSDIIFIFLATPSLNNGFYDHSQIENVAAEIIKTGKANKLKHLIICCTVMPTYCDLLHSKLTDFNYKISYNPEFIAQGSIVDDLQNPDIVLIGEADKSSGDRIKKIYQQFVNNKPIFHRMKRKEAEITKLGLNCFLTTKIAYANMIGDIARATDCNPAPILEAIGSDSRVGNKCLKYGFGFGGPCFPRDNRALGKFAEKIGINASISKASDQSNKDHLQYQINHHIDKYPLTEQYITDSVTYKSGTIIIEESQQLAFAVKLVEAGYKVIIKECEEVIEQVTKLYGDMFSYEINIK